MKRIIFLSSTLLIAFVCFNVSINNSEAKLKNNLPKVKKFRVIDENPRNIRLQWKKVKKAKFYQLKTKRYRANKKNKFVKREKSKKNVKRFRIRGLTPEKIYNFKIRACKKKKKCGKWSKRKQGETPAPQDDGDNDGDNGDDGDDDDDDEPDADPVLGLPLANVDGVTGIQTWMDPNAGATHTGFDFKLPNETEIIAPIDGTISQIYKFQMSNNLWVVDVFIKINDSWETFIAFEPYTYEESVIDDQVDAITVEVGDTVTQGQSLGMLQSVPATEFPHIHWQVQRGADDEVNPYLYVSDSAKAIMDTLCTTYSRPCEE